MGETTDNPSTVISGQDTVVTLSNNANQSVETPAPISNPSQEEITVESPLMREEPVKGEQGGTSHNDQEEVTRIEGSRENPNEGYSNRKVAEEEGEREKQDGTYTDSETGAQEQGTKLDRESDQRQEQGQEQTEVQLVEKKRASTFSDEEEERRWKPQMHCSMTL